MKRAFILSIVALLSASSVGADPIITLDQSSGDILGPGGFRVSGAEQTGQSFTPNLAGLDAVELWLNKQGTTDGSVFVRIREDNLTGTILGTSETKLVTGSLSQSSVESRWSS